MFRRRRGVCVATFTPQEAQVLRQVVAELAALLNDVSDRDDPAVVRLFPDVYRDDPAAAAELRRLTEAELRRSKLEQARTVLADLMEGGGQVRLSDEQADVWLRALTDVRLALGIRLGIDDDTDVEAELDAAVGRDPRSPRAGQLSLYAYLSFLQESLVAAMTSPNPAPDASANA